MRTRRPLTTALSIAIILLLATGVTFAASSGVIEPPPRTAFLARADNPADALAAGPIAGRMGAPLLTTYPETLDPEAEQGLVAYGPELVVLTGGAAALAPAVEARVRTVLPAATVRRVAGTTRTETARLVAELIDEYPPGFLPVEAKAADADLLDGLDSTDLSSQVTVTTLTGGPATITEPGTVYDLAFSPASAVTFTQQPGEVVMLTMTAEFDGPQVDALFCDLHAGVNLTRPDSGYDPSYTGVLQTMMMQRGDVWWAIPVMGRDSTRVIPSPGTATDYTVVGVAWMDAPEEGPDEACYGTQFGGEYQEVTASVRVSIVTLKS
jgi:hypothetical protein